MKYTTKILLLIIAGNIFLLNALFAQNNTLKPDVSLPWYKRFVGKIGNETGIIHVQKSYRNACVIIKTHSRDTSFKYFSILADNKIEAKPYSSTDGIVFRGEINANKLIGKLTFATDIEVNIEAEEDYTHATRVKLYECSYMEEGLFPCFANENNKYFYHYILSVVPEHNVERFEAEAVKNGFIKQITAGLKGEGINAEYGFWEQLHDEKVIFNQNNILIVSQTDYTFAGGAHGNYNTTYRHYDLEKNKLITVNDVFVKGYEKTVKPLLMNAFKEMNLAPIFIDTKKGIELSPDFRITPEKIYFLYQPYEIAPYAQGVVELGIPVSKLKSVIKPDTPIKRIME